MSYILTFEPTYSSCTLRFGEAAEHAEPLDQPYRGLMWSCVIAFDDHVRLSTGGELKRASVGAHEDVAGIITVDTAPIEWNGRQTTGLIRYHGAYEGDGLDEGIPQGYSVALRVSPETFERLVVFARQRQLPSITVRIPSNTPGLKMGWEPDGSGKDWETKDHPVLEVVVAQFTYPLIADDPLLAPPKPEPLAVVTQLLGYIAQKQKWLLAAVVALCALTIWRR